MNIGVAEVFHKGKKIDEMLNFVYSQDAALFSQAQKRFLTNYIVQIGVA